MSKLEEIIKGSKAVWKKHSPKVRKGLYSAGSYLRAQASALGSRAYAGLRTYTPRIIESVRSKTQKYGPPLAQKTQKAINAVYIDRFHLWGKISSCF